MSARLFFSNSLPVLLNRLVENLSWSDPFAAPVIATPNPSMRRWVQMRLADKLGIAANVDFMLLERLLWRRLAELDLEREAEGRKPARILDEQSLECLILALFQFDPPPEVRRYLDNGAADPRIFARRACQLAHQLAGLFREYEYSRVGENGFKGLAHLWKHGEDCFATYLDRRTKKEVRSQVRSLERWQKDVYHRIFRPGGLRDDIGARTGQYRYTLPQFAEMVLGQHRSAGEDGERPGFAIPNRPEGSRTPPVYHLFGLSQISPFHRFLIRRLSDQDVPGGWHATFCIYSLNPCATYWEDVLSPRARHKRLQEDLLRRRPYAGWRQLGDEEKDRLRLDIEVLRKEQLHLEEENPLLSQWGNPGRENVQLWNQLTDYDFSEYFMEPEGRTFLSSVQLSVLNRRGELSSAERRPQDPSLQILACPEIHREAETVHDSIIANLLADPGLRPEEIAVMVPDMDRYREVLAAVFEQRSPGEPGHIPYTLNDTKAASESSYVQGLKALFALAGGKLTRREVFDLVRNPCFQARHGLDGDTVRLWMRWADRLQVFRCFDGAHKSRSGYHPGPLHTWWHGLQRLLLGTVMEVPGPDEERCFEDLLPYADAGSARREDLRLFLEVLQALHRDTARLLEKGGRAWNEWLDLVGDLCESHLGVPAEAPRESYVQGELRRLIRSLREMDEVERAMRGQAVAAPMATGAGQATAPGREDQGSVPGEKVSRRGFPLESSLEAARPALILHLLETHLAGLPLAGRPYLSGGVNIATLSSLRCLPFRVVYILGLGEGKFPEDPASSTLDLRRYRRVIGDLDASARNRYWFLEALMSASQKLYLSYVDRDLIEDRRYQTSSVLSELVDFLEEQVLPPGRDESRSWEGDPSFGEDGKSTGFRIVPVPLIPHSPELYRNQSDEGFERPRGFSRADRIVAWMWENHRPAGAGRGEETDASAEGAAGLPRDWAHFDAATPEIPARIDLDDLCAYLDNPVKYTLERRLGLFPDRDSDLLRQDDEPFQSSPATFRRLLQSVCLDGLLQWEALSLDFLRASFERHYAGLVRRGLTPEGDYQDLDHRTLARNAESAFRALLEAAGNVKAGARGFTVLRNLRLGQAASPTPGGEPLRLPPLRAELPSGESLEVHGDMPLLLVPDQEGAACATVVPLTGTMDPKRILKPFLVYLLAQNGEHPLADKLRGKPFTVHFVEKHGEQDRENLRALFWRCFKVDPDAARTYLSGLLPEMLGRLDCDNLPLLHIYDRLTRRKVTEKCLSCSLQPTENCDKILRDALEDPFSKSRYRPPDAALVLGASVPRDAGAIIRRRFHLFFNGG